jgi:transposase
MRAATAPLAVSDGQRQILEKLAASQSAPHREVTRAKALLMAEEGLANTAIGAKLGVSPSSVVAWRKTFEAEGVVKFAQVHRGRGRKPSIPADKIDEIVRLTQESKPEGETHWSCRSMAKAAGVSPATVQRVWSSRGLKPHLVRTFKLSNDARFEEKLIDVVGLYLNPPDKAVVLCMDEKSSVQALDRTQASLPMIKGRAGTMTHDYKRHGTTTLFAALNVLTGVVIGRCLPRHRHGEFLEFLRLVDRKVPKRLQIHMILDNYGTHTHPNVQAWLAKHPRFHLHFTPTSSSWLNLVERWFRDITDKAIRRGVFASVPDLIAAIEAYLDANNANPEPFVWTASADAILEKVQPRPGSPASNHRIKTRHYTSSASTAAGSVSSRGRANSTSRSDRWVNRVGMLVAFSAS